MFPPPVRPRLTETLNLVVRIVSLGVAAFCLGSFLISFMLSVPLAARLPGMFAGVAIGFAALSLAADSYRNARVTRLCMIVAFLAAAAGAAYWMWRWSEQLLVRTIPFSSLGVIVLLAAIALVRRTGSLPFVGQALAAFVLVLGLLVVNERLQGTTPIGSALPTSLDGASSLVLLSVCALLSRPDRAMMELWLASGPAGTTARRLVLPMAVAPIALNLFLGFGVREGWYRTPTQEVLFTVSITILVLGLVAWQIRTQIRNERRKQELEAATAQARLEFHRLVDSVTDYAIYSLDTSGRIASWNPGARRIHGYSASEAIGRHHGLCDPDTAECRQKHDQLLEQARRRGRAVTDGWQRRRDGTRFYAHTTVTPVRAGHELVGYAKVTRDMTAQKAVESKQIRLQALLRTVADAIIVVDRNGRLDTTNPAAHRMFGYGGEEMAALNLSQLIPPPPQTSDEAHLLQLLHQQNRSDNRTVSGRRRDGTLFPAEITVAPMMVHGNRQYTVVVRDVTARFRAEEALRESEERLLLAVEAGQLGVWDMEVESGHMRASGPLVRVMREARPVTSGIVTMDGWIHMMHPDDQLAAAHALAALVAGETGSVEMEFRFQDPRADDGWRWLFARARADQRDARGRARRIIGVTIDIDARKRAEEDLRKSKRDLEIVLKGASFFLWHHHIPDGRVTDLGRLTESLGYAGEGRVNSVEFWRRIVHPDDLGKVNNLVLDPLPSALSDPHGVELRLRTASGDWRWMLARAWVIEWDREDRPVLVAGTCLDVTERKKAEEKLLHAAQHDSLTGLPNRALTYAFGEHILDTAKRHGGVCAVLFVDLDRFKPINDTYGHAAGDALLAEIAHRLRQSVRSDDVVGRLGGDEFLVVLAPLPSVEAVSRVAAKCLKAVRQPYHYKGMEFLISPSIGISLYPDDGRDMATLVKHADTAMYHAKEAGRNNFQFFTAAMNARVSTLLKMEHDLRHAVEREEFELVYQPVVDTETQEVRSAEALLRWPGSGFGPDEFVPVAESSGLIIPIGRWVLRKACEQQRIWSETGLVHLRMSVNISPVQFRQKGFLNMVATTVRECRIDPRDLQLEITETAVLRNVDEVIAVLKALRQHGHRIALDDFGKGYSSLNYLRNLPLDAVKVDKDFVHRLSSDPINLAITDTIIRLGHNLGLQVIAEGIESGEVLELLRERDCRLMQGYFIGEPMEAAAFEQWYLQSERRPGGVSPASGASTTH